MIMTIQKELFVLQDTSYADFQSNLIPNIPRTSIIGIRVPQLRKLAKKLSKEKDISIFLRTLPHVYYDENMLHSLLISEIQDFKSCISAIDTFLPFVDNWAVCDILSPRVFKQNHSLLLAEIPRWIFSKHPYTCRFGIEILMSHFLDDDFKDSYLKMPAQVHSDEYYVNMMIAWFFATALAKQWQATIPYLENGNLDLWVHNKTIQKARESYRITFEQKEYLKSLKK